MGAAAFSLASWIYPRFQHFPYLQFNGPAGRGKTHSQEVLAGICYQPEFTTCLTPAVVFRLVDKGCTLLVDEVNAMPTGGVMDALRAGFSRTTGFVQRNERKDDGSYTLRRFSVYGPKVLAGQHPLEDGALQSRMITENMLNVPQRDEPWPPFLPESFYSRKGSLRVRLGLWAAENKHLDYEPVVLPDEMESRARQTFLPLLAVTPPKYRPMLEALARRQRATVRREASDTPDMRVLQALLDMGLQDRGDVEFYPAEVSRQVNETLGLSEGHRDAMSNRMAGISLARLGISKGEHTRRGTPYAATAGQIASLALDWGLEPAP